MSIQEKITSLQHKFDTYNEMGRDYLPDELKKLRNYVFQIHSFYEEALVYLIGIYCFKDTVGLVATENIFKNLDFDQKRRITKKLYSGFPTTAAESLNSLRNKFAHYSGEKLREEFGGEQTIYECMKSLSDYIDKLDIFWLEHGGMTKTKALEHVKLNNKRLRVED